MLRFLLLQLFVFLAIFALAQPTPHLLDSAVNLYAKQKKFNGSVLVARQGTVLLQKGYGYRNVKEKAAADENTLYQYGSVTKQFTAALIMHLQEKGKLNVGDKVSKYFPDLPWADSVTLYHLLTHTSGIYNYTENGDFMRSGAEKPATREGMLALFKNHPLQFAPGSQFRYSNSGYSLLGYIAEKAGGAPYETLLRRAILQPAGMQTAGFDFAHNRSSARATGYDFIDGDSAYAAGIVDSSVAYAAGSLYGTVKDLYAWHRAVQKGALLQNESWTKIFTPFRNKYAFGWGVDTVFGRRVEQHNGGIFGFTSTIKRFPNDDVVVVVLSNNSSPKVDEIAANLAALVFAKPVKWPKERVAVTLPEEKLKPLAGEYALGGRTAITVRFEKGGLVVQPQGQPATALLAEGENKFFIQTEDFFISFDKDAAGAVTGFTLHQNGGEMKAKKTK